VDLAHHGARVPTTERPLPDFLAFLLAAVALHVANQCGLVVVVVEGFGDEVQRHAAPLGLFREDGQVDRVTAQPIR
jgi:hypothetical protein